MVGDFDLYPAILPGSQRAGAIIVSTPQDVALADVQKGIAMFRKISVPVGKTFAKSLLKGGSDIIVFPFTFCRSPEWF